MKINKNLYVDLQKMYEMSEEYSYSPQMLEHIYELESQLRKKINVFEKVLYDKYMNLGLENLIEKYFEPGDVIQIRDYWEDIKVESGCWSRLSIFVDEKYFLKEVNGVKVYYKGALKK